VSLGGRDVREHREGRMEGKERGKKGERKEGIKGWREEEYEGSPTHMQPCMGKVQTT
jgi:hypothetical protein